jgi:carboxyl-terminal processing protease
VSRLRRWPAAAAALVLVLLLGFASGVFVDQVYPDQVPSVFLHSSRSQLDSGQLNQALRIIQADYYNRNLNYANLSHGTVRGLVQALGDPYSSYLDPTGFKNERAGLQGSHNGQIGIAVSFQNGFPVVESLLPGSPAAKAGLQGGDVIVKVDGKDTMGLTADQTAVLIRGPAGSHVTLTVQRVAGAPPLDVDVQRLDFTSPSVVSLMVNTDILYVRIYQFGTNTQTELDSQLSKALPGARGVILDLRDNPGGLVDAATRAISEFVSSGEAFEQRDRNGQVERQNVTGTHPAPTIPLIALVNANSASASEITAGSLQARGRAMLVGTKTFGKGSVQLDYPLLDGSDLHITIKHWFLPNGQSVDKVGLTPDYAVSLPNRADMFDVVEPARGHAGDTQLNRALELMPAS